MKVFFECPDVFLANVITNNEKKPKTSHKKKARRNHKKDKWKKRRRRMKKRTRRWPEDQVTEKIEAASPVAQVEKKSEESTLSPAQDLEGREQPPSERIVFALKACTDMEALQRMNRHCAIILNRDHNAAKNILHCGLRTLRNLPQLPTFKRAQ